MLLIHNKPGVSMKVIQKCAEIQKLCSALCCDRKTIGFVPTMGFLHEGHMSLITKARQDNEIVVVSIFVNPTQFGPGEDLDNYPQDLESDIKKLHSSGVDLVFTPTASEMYSKEHSTFIHIGALEHRLCGQSRPHHFRGVVTVVVKLFNLINPTRAYFGQKDFQQVVILKKMVRELNFKVEIITCPIVRESNGIALSSRNKYLSDEERKSATVLYKALKYGENLIMQGNYDSAYIKKEMKDIICQEKDVLIEYVEVVSANDLKDLKMIKKPALLALAVIIGRARLIDNLLINENND
jgi:pantoate--beta-alanine ligase